MTKHLITAFFMALPFTLAAQTITLATGLSHPESVISDGHFLYVSDIGKEMTPDAKDGDGAIRKLSLQGKIIEQNISKAPLNAPKGSAIAKGVLYVADVDRLAGIDLKTGALVTEISFSGEHTSFLNDVAKKDDNTLFVSATDIGKVFEVKIDGSRQVKALAIRELPMANGLYYDAASQQLYTCNMTGDKGPGETGVISWSNGQPSYRKVSDISGIFDGIALVDRNMLLVSDWTSFSSAAGILRKIDLPSQKATNIQLPVIAGPADFYYDKARGQLLIPVMLEGKIIVYKIK